jgi:hypothetical protein
MEKRKEELQKQIQFDDEAIQHYKDMIKLVEERMKEDTKELVEIQCEEIDYDDDSVGVADSEVNQVTE